MDHLFKNDKWKLITRKDLGINNWDDIVLFRIELIDRDYHTKTIYKRENISGASYRYEDYIKHYLWWSVDMTSYKIDGTVAKYIRTNFEKIVWIWDLEEDEYYASWGAITELYFSNWIRWAYFSYTRGHNLTWENMTKLIKIQKEIEELLKSLKRKI